MSLVWILVIINSALLEFFLMSLFAKPERNAVAQQVADGLNRYQAIVDEWMLKPGNLDLYEKVCAEIDSVRVVSSSALPQATGALSELLVAHTNLTFIVLKKHLVRLGAIQDRDEQLASARDAHCVAVSEMASLCVRICGRRKG
jgi:hypothetical protein